MSTTEGSTTSTSSANLDFVFKFIIIGDTGTGKSCTLHQFVEREFRNGPPKHTIGVEFGSRVLEMSDRRVKLQIWDTAGQERFRSVTRSYYRGAVGALVFYDITNRETFNHVESWLNDAKMLTKRNVSIVIVGNKSDLSEQRQVSFLEGSSFAQQHEAMFIETSALTRSNVDEVFHNLTKSILIKIDDNIIDINDMVRKTPIKSQPTEEEAGGCAC